MDHRPRPVRRLHDTARFHEEHFLRGSPTEPVVFEGAALAMPAYRWTDAYLLEVLGDARPTVRLPSGRLARMRIADFFDYIAAPERFASKVGPVYLTDFYVKPTFGDPARERLSLDSVCPLPRPEPLAEWISMYAGPAGTTTPCHQDVFETHTWLAEIRGTKRWRLAAPDSFPADRAAPIDLFGEDARVGVIETDLAPGDVIYLPPNWWHQVQNDEATLALSGNFCTWEHARWALEEARRQPEPLREVWTRTWEAVLALEPLAMPMPMGLTG